MQSVVKRMWSMLRTLLACSIAGHASAYSCAQFNQQSDQSERNLLSELAIANQPLSESEASDASTRFRKLDQYIEQFADDTIVHGVQGRPEPANKSDMREHYQYVLTAAKDQSNTEADLRETVKVVAGPMAAHRYKAGIRVAAFPPDFAYYDPKRLLRLRGQTVFDYGAQNGKILRRWSNHDNKYRTGQLWRYMLNHSPAQDAPANLAYRKDLRRGDELPGGKIDQDGERLNRVFNGELLWAASDFVLNDQGQFYYGPALPVESRPQPVSEKDGLQFARRFVERYGSSGIEDLFAEDAGVYGVGCHQQAANGLPARGSARSLAKWLQEEITDQALVSLAPPFSFDGGYDYLPISTWSMLGLSLKIDRPQKSAYCVSVVLKLVAVDNPKQADLGIKISRAWHRVMPEC